MPRTPINRQDRDGKPYSRVIKPKTSDVDLSRPSGSSVVANQQRVIAQHLHQHQHGQSGVNPSTTVTPNEQMHPLQLQQLPLQHQQHLPQQHQQQLPGRHPGQYYAQPGVNPSTTVTPDAQSGQVLTMRDHQYRYHLLQMESIISSSSSGRRSGIRLR